MNKNFRLSAADIKAVAPGIGGCYASDQITVEGLPVGYMYREQPDFPQDSGWRFFSGHESQDFADEPTNFAIYDVNTIANYDRAIVPYLDAPIDAAFEREDNGTFRRVEDPDPE